MRIRSYIASLLLTIYLFSVGGYALSIICCHCPQSEHYKSHTKVCCSCSHSHQSECEGLRAEQRCNCNHTHTTEVALYDVAKVVNPLINSLVCEMIPSDTTLSEGYAAECFGHSFFVRLKIPLPQSAVASSAALRAPPVLA
ncbi:MAG: hypothetical protein IIX04_01630 [Alistipes sp.]|nr:hypothetical protein [Alistipes sp.]MBR0393790.1 hypothetical protein [Alistipes sp.]